MHITINHMYHQKVENFQFHDILINMNSIPPPETNVLIGNIEDGITETVLFAPDFQFPK